jgi:hypothetical protein
MPATFNPFSQAPPLELPQSYARSGYSDLRTACSNRYRDAGRTIDELLDQEEVAENKRRQDRKEAEARIAETMQRNPNISRAPKRISFMPLVERLRIQATKIKEDYERAIFVPRLSSSFGDPSFNDRTRDGEQVFRQILKAFVSFPDPPTPFQHKLFAACASACAPMIFGEEFFSDPTRCLSIIGGRYTDGIVGVLTGRKTGKSTGLAYIAIAFMFVIKNWKGIIVSKTLEQAKIILDTIKGLIQVHPLWAELGFKVVESRATALVIQSKDRSLRWIESRCGSGEVRVVTPSSFWCRSGLGCDPWSKAARSRGRRKNASTKAQGSVPQTFFSKSQGVQKFT